MSFQGLSQIDFSTLPKIRTHTQLGNLGQPSGCSIWNPLTYPTCSTWIIQARTELANAHNAILDLANGWQSRISEIYLWPESQGKTNALAEANQKAQEAYQLVQQHSQVQSEYEAKVQPFSAIGLAGIGSPQLSGLGLAPWAIITLSSLIITALSAWGVASAIALNNSYKAQAQYYNQFVEYYKTCQQLAVEGKPCNIQGPSTQGPGTAWSSQLTILAILGLIGGVMILSRR